ncbi:hypothetical protein KI387_004258, partial [Taxus chinensis]
TSTVSGIHFPIQIEEYQCPNLFSAQLMEKEFTLITIHPYVKRAQFDINGYMQNILGDQSTNIVLPSKSFWAACSDEHE